MSTSSRMCQLTQQCDLGRQLAPTTSPSQLARANERNQLVYTTYALYYAQSEQANDECVCVCVCVCPQRPRFRIGLERPAPYLVALSLLGRW